MRAVYDCDAHLKNREKNHEEEEESGRGDVVMHARRAFLTNLSCLQPFLLKRRYVRNVPPHLFFSPLLP